MDLISVSVTGWRRFADTTTIQTNGKLVSILGPNEAGKSSLLQAIHFLRSADDAEFSDIARDTNPEALAIVGHFYLSDEELRGACLDRPTRLILTKTRTGVGRFRLDPQPPLRDLSAREYARAQLDRVRSNEKFVELIDDDFHEALATLSEVLSSSDETLADQAIDSLVDAAAKLDELELSRLPKYVQSLSAQLLSLMDHERKPTPRQIANDFIKDQIPSILMFGEEERDLQQEYSFEDLAEEVPVALANLASVASLISDHPYNVQCLLDPSWQAVGDQCANHLVD